MAAMLKDQGVYKFVFTGRRKTRFSFEEYPMVRRRFLVEHLRPATSLRKTRSAKTSPATSAGVP